MLFHAVEEINDFFKEICQKLLQSVFILCYIINRCREKQP